MKHKPHKLTPNQAVILETAVREGAVRWGYHATHANVWRRDAVFRLARAGMLLRVASDPAVVMQWELTDAGRSALETWQSRRQSPARTSDAA